MGIPQVVASGDGNTSDCRGISSAPSHSVPTLRGETIGNVNMLAARRDDGSRRPSLSQLGRRVVAPKEDASRVGDSGSTILSPNPFVPNAASTVFNLSITRSATLSSFFFAFFSDGHHSPPVLNRFEQRRICFETSRSDTDLRIDGNP